MRRIVLTGVLTLVVSALAALPAYGTRPGKNGQIVFVGPAPSRLWVINPDGTGLHKLTVEKGAGVADEDPDWSPDGSKLAFSRCTRIGPCRVWTSDRDGTGARPIGPAGADFAEPAWSPNGRLIAVSRFWGGVQNDQTRFAEIVVLSGSGLRRLTHVTIASPYSADVEYPAWSPNGRQLAFTVHNSKTGDPAGGRALFVVNADGSGLHQVTPWELNGGGRSDWSPDGKVILFRLVSATHPDRGNLATIHPDGTGLKRLTNYPEKTLISGSFSPDGKWITFSRFTTFDYPSVFVVRSNGTGVRQVTPSDVHGIAFAADWGSAR